VATDVIEVVRDIDGKLHLREGDVPPPVVAFSPGLIVCLRRGDSVWAAIERDGQGREVVVMRLCPLALRYRLTGEVDLTGGMVGERIDEDGELWTDR
jgi:hypothetical protein